MRPTVRAAAAPGAKVVAALQHVPAASLNDLDQEASCDVLVAGDDDDARATVIGLVDQAFARAEQDGTGPVPAGERDTVRALGRRVLGALLEARARR